MSIARCRWALAFFSISALATIELVASEPPYHMVRAAELEADLASTRATYLVVGVESGSLAVRARGVTLESLPVASVNAYEMRPLIETRPGERLEIPRLFTVAATISLIDRKVVAPESLSAWSDEPDKVVRPAGDEVPPVAPQSYDVPLDGGWILEIRQDEPARNGWGRIRGAATDGWARLTGRATEVRGPALRLVMDPAAAAKVHHLFRKGTAIVIVMDAADHRTR